MAKKNPFALYQKKPRKKSLIVERSIEKSVIDTTPETRSTTVKTIGIPSSSVSLKGLFLFLLLIAATILYRIFFLQIVEGTTYQKKAEENRIQTITVPALRGVIFDSKGKPLVKNIPNFQLIVNANDLLVRNTKAIEKEAALISEMTEIPVETIISGLEDSLITGTGAVLQNEIPYEDALSLMIDVEKSTSAHVEVRYNREYTQDASFGHILGYMSKMTQENYDALKESGYLLNDMLGTAGIEKSYETELRGEYGIQEIEVDFQGRKKTLLNEKTEVRGKDIYLSIDTELQKSLYNAIGGYVDRLGLPGGSAVAIDPQTGNILALVSYPSYDNNIFTGEFDEKAYEKLLEDDRNPFINRAISGTYPSGSVFKPIVAAAALEENIVNENTTFLSTGGIEIEGYRYPDWKAGGHGVTNVTKALAESVNTYFYYIGGGDNENIRGLGVERITEYAKKFGLYQQLGIDLPGEETGFLPSKDWKEEVKNEKWYLGDTYNVSIGQGDVLVTPFQVAAYTAAIANGGTLYQPSLLKKMITQENETIQKEPVVLQEQVVSKKNIEIVQQGMREAVIYGSARSLATELPVSSAAKTGTAQFGSEGKTHAWFTVYAPYEKPEIALTILLEGGGGGDGISKDVAEEVLYEYFTK